MATLLQRHDQPDFYASMYSIFQLGRNATPQSTEQSTLDPEVTHRQAAEDGQVVQNTTRGRHPVCQDVGATSSRAQPTTPSRRKLRKVSIEPETKTASQPQTHTSTPLAEPAPISMPVAPMTGNPTGTALRPDPDDQPTNTTPKQKLLKLGKNGKLADTAPVPIRTSPRTHRTLPSKQQPSQPPTESKAKNLKMRNGKLTQSLVVRLCYRREDSLGSNVGDHIAKILAGPAQIPSSDPLENRPQSGQTKTTHPFFTGKSRQHRLEQQPSTATDVLGSQKTGTEPDHANMKPVAWSDIVFKSKRTTTSTTMLPQKPMWPPRTLQHVGAEHRSLSTIVRKATEKRSVRLQPVDFKTDDLLHALPILPSHAKEQYEVPLLSCKMHFVPGQQLVSALDDARLAEMSHTSLRARNQIIHGTSYFDRAEAAGPLMWPQQYAPTCWQDILQPSAQVLHDWLRTLAVHNVKQGLDNPLMKQLHKPRKRGRKPKDELDDFIVDDDDPTSPKPIRNAILLVGPNGCGKTASVYAAAKQLNFEVFEIHAGECRSQRDIFDRVGNMTQNHLVQSGQLDSRGSSIAPEDLDNPASLEADAHQPSVAGFFTTPQARNSKADTRPMTPQPGKREQKQSLILLEEVDNVFEEDRSFWAGVQSLIQKSRRPVVMTCNDASNLPLEEIELHDVLQFKPSCVDTTVDYLAYVAAAEGHLLDREALQRLYLSTGCDLRSSLTQLNFWCQMTVGSRQGGLEWYLSQPKSVREGLTPRHRIFSRDTYRADLHLYQDCASDIEEILRFGQLCLDVEPRSLDLDVYDKNSDLATVATSILDRSDAELLDNSVQPLIYSMLFREHDRHTIRNATFDQLVQKYGYNEDKHQIMLTALEPLLDEPPTFPPAQGRLAPSLDCWRHSVATDIAPYIRTIAAFDRRLEQQREDLFSSQGKKSRNTRAARAAAEGGDKATSRRDRWFGKELDMDAVLATGGVWPQWYDNGHETAEVWLDGQDIGGKMFQDAQDQGI